VYQGYKPNSKVLDGDEVSALHSVSVAFVLGIDAADLLGEQTSPRAREEIVAVGVPLDMWSEYFATRRLETLTRR